MADKNFLILGGAGLVGLQVAFRIANDLTPEQIVIASLYNREVREAVDQLQHMFGKQPIKFTGVAGNIFVRSGFADKSREWLLNGYARREALYDDLLGPVQEAYEQSQLVKIIREHRPDVIVDCINTATAISYQDVYAASRIAKSQMDNLFRQVAAKDAQNNVHSIWKETEKAFETLLLSEAVPQLVRHVILLNQAMREVGTRMYVKVGTTGTGGMGLNVPYTHGEDKPSAKLMSKTAVGFAHTGLLFLMARTQGGPIVKEVKPGAMIGYKNVSCRTIHEHGQTVHVYTSRTDQLNDSLILRTDKSGFEQLHTLDLPIVDTGENGLFTKGEFEAITSLRQMEFITPEEIARDVVLEIRGSNTGKDVIAAIDGAVMNPTYRAGYLRQQVLDVLERLEQETETHSVALGQLGPPQLSKLLWEAELMRLEFDSLEEILAHTAEEISAKLYQRIQEDEAVRLSITSIGLPILAPNGNDLIRGPFIRIPETVGEHAVPIRKGDVDRWATKGWVDLRPKNFVHWQERFRIMERARQLSYGQGSAAIIREVYPFKDIRPGTIVGWIFNNEEYGYRIK
jgi:hypothetical protein